MSNLLLRTLTLKSIIGFGNFKDMTVQNLFDLRMEKELISIYYSLDKINYNKEIIEKLAIPENLIIQKPGRKKEFIGEYWRYIINKRKSELSEKEYMEIGNAVNSLKRKVSKINDANTNHKTNLSNSKRALQYKNQKH